VAVAGIVGDLATLAMAQMVGNFDFHGTLDQHLGKLFEQTIFTNQVFGFVVVGKQAVGQLANSESGLAPLVRFT